MKRFHNNQFNYKQDRQQKLFIALTVTFTATWHQEIERELLEHTGNSESKFPSNVWQLLFDVMVKLKSA